MNKRIEKLAEQCRIETYGVNGELLAFGFDEEKFALLIVQECLNQCYNRGMDDELYAGQLKAATYIEEYFGVEE